MQKDKLKLKTKEMHFSLKAFEARKDPPVGDFQNWNAYSDRVPPTHGAESPASSVFTKMVSCPPCTWG